MDISVIFKKKYLDIANELEPNYRLAFYDFLFNFMMNGEEFDDENIEPTLTPIISDMTREIMKFYKMDFIDIWTTIWHKNPEDCKIELSYKDLK